MYIESFGLQYIILDQCLLRRKEFQVMSFLVNEVYCKLGQIPKPTDQCIKFFIAQGT